MEADRPGELELTILMPCLNEAETIAACVSRASGFLQQSDILGEVLIADNGSTDGSTAIAERGGARIIRVEERGYGAALMGGIMASRGRFVVMGDADASYDFGSLLPFVEALRSGADLVMGNRFKGGIAPGAMPPSHRYLGNPVLSALGRRFFHVPIGDFHCGLRGFRRDRIVGLGLRTTGMEFASEMVVKAALSGYRIEEVPTRLYPDGRSRPPHLRTWRDGWRHLRFLLIYSPRWLFLYPGLALVAVGGAIAVALFPGPVRVGAITLDVHTFIAGCISVLIGVQSISMGILARRYAAARGLLPPPRRSLSAFLIGLSLERLLMVALCAFVVAVVGLAWSIAQWVAVDFGQIADSRILRTLVVSLTALAAAIQLALTAFLGGVMETEQR